MDAGARYFRPRRPRRALDFRRKSGVELDAARHDRADDAAGRNPAERGPSEARGVLNIRLLPGNMASPLLAKLQTLVNDPAGSIRSAAERGRDGPFVLAQLGIVQHDFELWRSKQFPGAVVVPEMSTSATDSVQLRLRNVQAYGMLPFPMTEQDRNRMHANDERLPVDSFRKGVDFLYAIVSDFAMAK